MSKKVLYFFIFFYTFLYFFVKILDKSIKLNRSGKYKFLFCHTLLETTICYSSQRGFAFVLSILCISLISLLVDMRENKWLCQKNTTNELIKNNFCIIGNWCFLLLLLLCQIALPNSMMNLLMNFKRIFFGITRITIELYRFILKFPI